MSAPELWPAHPRPLRRSEWGYDMTLCIAAIGQHKDGPMIVTASDLMLSDTYYGFSTETLALKFDPLGPARRWIAMFSGSPTVRRHVVDRAEALLNPSNDDTLDVIVAAMETAYRDELKRKQEGEVLSQIGLDRERFLRSRGKLGQDEFSRLLNRIEAVNLDTDFLVAGWEADGVPRIFSVHHPGIATQHDSLGFYAIGSGWLPAMGSLYRTYDRYLSPADLVFRVCEAKFLGETAPGVGKFTVVYTIRNGGTHKIYSPDHVRQIRDFCAPGSTPSVPDQAREIAKAGLPLGHPIKWAGPK